jgi:hypothetical protein
MAICIYFIDKKNDGIFCVFLKGGEGFVHPCYVSLVTKYLQILLI